MTLVQGSNRVARRNPAVDAAARFTPVLAAALLAGCLASAPTGQGGTSAAASTSGTSARPARSTAVLHREGASLASVARELFDVNGRGRLGSALPVNGKCGTVGATSRELFTYVAGDCNSFGQPEGMAAGAVRTGSVSRDLVVEGLFVNGMPQPGLLYRVNRAKRDYGWASSPKLRGWFECTDMKILVTPGVNRQALETLRFSTSSSSKCVEAFGVEASLGWAREMEATTDGAITSNGSELAVNAKVKGRGRYLHRDHVEQFEGEFLPSDSKGKSANHALGEGTQWVIFNDSTMRYVAAEGQLCVEGSDVCAPMQPPFVRYRKGASGPPLGPFKANNGDSFEALAGGESSGSNASYQIWYGKRRPATGQVMEFGDAIFLQPVSGTLTASNGRRYSGRFVDGKPLF